MSVNEAMGNIKSAVFINRRMHFTSGAQALLTYWCATCRTRDKRSLDNLRGRRGEMQFEFSKVHLSYTSDTLILFALTKWPSGDPPAMLLEILMSERVPYLL